MKALVFGSYVADLMSRSPRLPQNGETVKGSFFKMGPGGKGFNQCVAAHKAGASVSMCTKIARDSFGEVALRAMEELRMPQDNILYSAQTATGIALIMVDEHTSENKIVIVPGACAEITKEEIDALEPVLKDCEYLLLQLEVNQDANEYVVELARRNHCRVILNTAPFAPISDTFLGSMWLVTPNEHEAEELSGVAVSDLDSARQAAAYFHSKGVENVIITLGAKGVFLSTPEGSEILPAYHVDAIDTTGAGDAFNGGMLAALTEGKSLREAALFGNATAALSVQKLGTTPSMPLRKEIDAFIKEHRS
mgnify:CR=1 FL=1